MRAVVPLLVLVLVACGRDHAGIQPDLPTACTAVAPEVQVIERIVYVPIKRELTREEPIAEGPIAQCFDVAAKRRAALERINSRVREISEIQGTEVEP